MHTQIIKLESKRLMLYPMDETFCTEIYLSWLNDPEVYKYLETRGGLNLYKLRRYIKRAVKKKVFFWAIVHKKSGNHIGNIKIDPINFYHKRGEYGILIGDKTVWGNGFASEASELVIDFCFNTLKLRKLTLGVVELNKEAVKLYLKLGFVREGIYVNHGYYENKLRNIYRMAIFNKQILNE